MDSNQGTRRSGFTVRRSCRCATSPYRFQAAGSGPLPLAAESILQGLRILVNVFHPPGRIYIFLLFYLQFCYVLCFRSKNIFKKLVVSAQIMATNGIKKGPERGPGCVEPTIGIEPTTACLQDRGSTIELRWRMYGPSRALLHGSRYAARMPSLRLSAEQGVELCERLSVQPVLHRELAVPAVADVNLALAVQHVYLVREHGARDSRHRDSAHGCADRVV